MDDLDMDTQIRRRNLRTAWRLWVKLTPAELGQLIDACRREWGAGWLSGVLR